MKHTFVNLPVSRTQRILSYLLNNGVKEWAIFFFLTFIVYSPAFFIEFATHNDYYRWRYNPSLRLFGFPETKILFSIGRPLNALILNLEFRFIKASVASMSLARFISFLFIPLTAWFVVQYFKNELHIDHKWAFIIAFCIFISPPYQIFVLWLTIFAPGCVAVLLAALSYYMLNKSFANRYTANTSLIFCSIESYLSFLFILASLFIYPPSAMFVFSLIFMRLLFISSKDWGITKHRIIFESIFYLFSMALYFIVVHYIMSLQGIGEHTLAFTKHLGKMKLFYKTLIEPSLTTFGLLAGKSASYVIFLIIFFFIAYLFYTFYSRENSREGVFKYLKRFQYIFEAIGIAVVLFIMSFAPLLFSVNAVRPWTRTIFAPSVIMITIPIAILYRLKKIYPKKGMAIFATTFVLIIALASFMIAYQNILKTALNLNTELNFIRQSCNIENLDKKEKILIVTCKDWLIREDLWGDFQFMATSDAYAVLGIFDAVFAEHGLKSPAQIKYYESKDRLQAQIEHSISADRYLLVDMNVASLRRNIDQATDGLLKVTASAGNPFNLFDRKEGTFWQVSGSRNYQVQLEFGNPQALQYYAFQAEKANLDQAPTEWKLFSSQDGTNWKEIDAKTEDKTMWQSSTSRVYTISDPALNKYYRFEFLTTAERDQLCLNEIVLIF